MGADGEGGAESGAVAEGGAADPLSLSLRLMLREFHDALPGELMRLAIVWGIRPGSPAAAALGLPGTDTDKTDETFPT